MTATTTASQMMHWLDNAVDASPLPPPTPPNVFPTHTGKVKQRRKGDLVVVVVIVV